MAMERELRGEDRHHLTSKQQGDPFRGRPGFLCTGSVQSSAYGYAGLSACRPSIQEPNRTGKRPSKQVTLCTISILGNQPGRELVHCHASVAGQSPPARSTGATRPCSVSTCSPTDLRTDSREQWRTLLRRLDLLGSIYLGRSTRASTTRVSIPWRQRFSFFVSPENYPSICMRWLASTASLIRGWIEKSHGHAGHRHSPSHARRLDCDGPFLCSTTSQ